DAIRQLQLQDKLDEIRTIEKEEALVRQLVEKLHVAKSSADFENIESELRGAEIRLLQEMKRLGLNHFMFRRDLRQDLTGKGTKLMKQAKIAMQKLGKV